MTMMMDVAEDGDLGFAKVSHTCIAAVFVGMWLKIVTWDLPM